MISFVKHHTGYSDEEIWDMTLDRLQLEYHFANVYMKQMAQMVGVYSIGGTF